MTTLAALATLPEGPLNAPGLVGFGHRVAHGGPDLREPVRVNADTLARIAAVSPLAPRHNPPAVAVLKTLAARYSDLPQVACFDTAFDRTHPAVADRFAIPDTFYQRGMRRYGFHGLSYEYIASALVTSYPAVAPGRMVVALASSMGGSDAMVSTAGTGERSSEIRAHVPQRMEWLGFTHDSVANGSGGPLLTIQDSPRPADVIPRRGRSRRNEGRSVQQASAHAQGMQGTLPHRRSAPARLSGSRNAVIIQEFRTKSNSSAGRYLSAHVGGAPREDPHQRDHQRPQIQRLSDPAPRLYADRMRLDLNTAGSQGCGEHCQDTCDPQITQRQPQGNWRGTITWLQCQPHRQMRETHTERHKAQRHQQQYNADQHPPPGAA